MSRVDDDREAARAAERQMQARRNEETQRNKRAAEGNAFTKLVGQQQAQAKVQQQKAKEKDADLGKSAIASLLEAAESHSTQEAKSKKDAQGTNTSRLVSKNLSDGLNVARRDDARQQDGVAESGRQSSEHGANVSQAEQGSTARGLEGRKADAKHTREVLAEAAESGELNATGANAGAGGARGEKGDLKADTDKGGGQGQGGGQKDDKNSPTMQPGFRFNPALMAPVPVAKAKEATGSDRLRKVANELAQKIVERVRVGTNAAGKVEFQIDLRSDVLKGLSVKVSSHNGKIKAVFQGSDRDVMKMIEEQKEALTAALSSRGLTLEDFKVESR